ncbi:MAG: SH3 domain-containing protein, partial [Desulfovibrionaceae bacterium]|nr:SH3 domain-containing protein [Desulfovibrionaceae bacterium]
SVTAVAPVPKPPPAGPQTHVHGLPRMPQDPAYCANGPGKDRPLLTAHAKAALADDFIQAYFAPWRGGAKPVAKRDAAAPFRAFAASPGYAADNLPNPPDFAAQLEANAGLPSYPNLNRPAVTVEAAALRALPTMAPSYLDPSRPGEGYPFDYLQYANVPQNTPLTARHASRDGQWIFVEMAMGQGWLPSSAVAFVDEAFMSAFQTGSYAAFIREGVDLALADANGRLRGGLGSVFPVESQGAIGPSGASGLTALAAVRQGDRARLAHCAVGADQAALIPLEATPANIAAAARQLIGQTYGWGGLDGKRDCSLMVRDLFTPFGVWLPRNSSAQAKAAPSTSLAGLTPEQKEQAILRDGVPFLTLITLPGHIGLYIGTFEGRPVMLHDIWGVRTRDATGSEGRRVIGATVITTLTPGRELPDYDRDRNIIGRVDGMTFLGR